MVDMVDMYMADMEDMDIYGHEHGEHGYGGHGQGGHEHGGHGGQLDMDNWTWTTGHGQLDMVDMDN